MKKIFVTFILFCFSFFSIQGFVYAAKKYKATRSIEIQTQDDVILYGKLTIPENASAKNKAPIIILLHSLGGNNSIYANLSMQLKNNGFATLAIDSRGHGQSTIKLNGKRTFWQNYSNKIYAKYPTDINDVIKFLAENYVSIDATKIGIVGADINANAAVVVAGKNTSQIKTIALISPSISFKGLNVSSSLMNYKNPTLIIVSKNDIAHYNDAQILTKYPAGKSILIETQKGGTGDNLIKTNLHLIDVITNWFQENM